jgi:hypothetical protein
LGSGFWADVVSGLVLVVLELRLVNLVLGLRLGVVVVAGVELELEELVGTLELEVFGLGLVVVTGECPGVVLLLLVLFLVVCRLRVVQLIPGLRLVEVEPVLG